MHQLAGTKRGAFLSTEVNTNETGTLSSSISASELKKAQKILESHHSIQELIPGLSQTHLWRNLPEIPSTEEILTINNVDSSSLETEPWNSYQKEPLYDAELPSNVIKGPWSSKEEYITAHYKILREDAIASLRRAVSAIKSRPTMMDDDSAYIYTEVTITGWQFSRSGPACRVEFCTDRSEKRIRWPQSKRLQPGTLVALSPYNDLFQTKCRNAVVAARPFQGGLDQNPPTIDLFLGDTGQVELDPHEKFIMVESKQGYFEASRHKLVAMQKLMSERFPLANHIVSLDRAVEAPEYLEAQPSLNLESLDFSHENLGAGESHFIKARKLRNVDVLKNFPQILNSDMDESQQRGLKDMLTKRVAIIQGPPGCGKTFVSALAIRIMIQNLGPHDPPIIVAAQTNHALDQLLNHILIFDPNIVRLGGRSELSNKAIRKRTLYELRASNPFRDGNAGLGKCYKQWQKSVEKLKKVLSPLLQDKLITSEQLIESGIITKEQYQSLFASDWADSEMSEGEIAAWLGGQKMAILRASPVNLGLPLEDEQIENTKSMESDESGDMDGLDEFDNEGLGGDWVPYQRKFTGKHRGSVDAKKWKKRLAKTRSLYEIHESERGLVYRYFEMRIDAIMKKEFKAGLREYYKAVNDYKVAKALSNIRLLHHIGIKVVGCTTTGLSKYRGFLSALQPRTLLIEEAAETLEGNIIGGMFESLEQLILVGDHQQLQASCTIRRLEDAPYHMNVSMFERLVKNKFPYVMLNEQRRMISDVRQLLCIEPSPFYRNLRDSKIVLDRVYTRPPVPGMGGKDTYFFHHNWPESRNVDGSCYNNDEAQMITGFFYYLWLNGTDASMITVLAFYNGQKKEILNALKKHAGLASVPYFNVHTVDGYQGEENDVILLSLVRSNLSFNVGFLENKSRLIVALSRARRGLYIFGNAVTLTATEQTDDYTGREPLWGPLIEYMKIQGRFEFERGLPVTCTQHQKVTRIYESSDFFRPRVNGGRLMAGGCTLPCDKGLLSCGHSCNYNCHPFEHDQIECTEPCARKLKCGHLCNRICGNECRCDLCSALNDENFFNKHLSSPADYKMIATSQVKLPDGHSLDYTGQAWIDWDAKEADLKVSKQNQANKLPNTKISTVMLEDVHQTVVLKNNMRTTRRGLCEKYVWCSQPTQRSDLELEKYQSSYAATFTEQLPAINNPVSGLLPDSTSVDCRASDQKTLGKATVSDRELAEYFLIDLSDQVPANGKNASKDIYNQQIFDSRAALTDWNSAPMEERSECLLDSLI